MIGKMETLTKDIVHASNYNHNHKTRRATMNAASLSLIAGTLLSLIFSYIPRADGSFKKLDGIYKRLIMLGCLALVAGSVYGLACLGIGEQIGIAVICDQKGAISLISQFILAMIANQSTYTITPQKKSKQKKSE